MLFFVRCLAAGASEWERKRERDETTDLIQWWLFRQVAVRLKSQTLELLVQCPEMVNAVHHARWHVTLLTAPTLLALIFHPDHIWKCNLIFIIVAQAHNLQCSVKDDIASSSSARPDQAFYNCIALDCTSPLPLPPCAKLPNWDFSLSLSFGCSFVGRVASHVVSFSIFTRCNNIT